MLMHFNNKMMSKAFFWFAVITGIFGFVTEIYGQNIYLPTDFYLTIATFAMLGSIASRHLD